MGAAEYAVLPGWKLQFQSPSTAIGDNLMDEHKIEGDSSSAVAGDEIIWSDLAEGYTPAPKALGELIPESSLSEADKEAPFWLFFQSAAHEQMLNDASRDTSREHGGILTGDAYKDTSGKYYVLIKEA